MDIQTVLTLLLGAGGTTFILAAVRGWNALRSGAVARRRDAIADLERWRDESDEARRLEAMDKTYLLGVVGGLRYQLRQAGVVPIPEELLLPSDQLRALSQKGEA